MAITVYFLCIGVLCGAGASPLGGQSACESMSNMYPLPLQNIGLTTVCESSPNLLGVNVGYPYPLNYPGYLPYPNPWCPYPYIDSLGYYPYPNVPTTTVCETSPNVVGIRPFPNVPVPVPLPVPNVQTSTVCETTPSVLPVNPCVASLPYPGLVPGYSPYGMPFL